MDDEAEDWGGSSMTPTLNSYFSAVALTDAEGAELERDLATSAARSDVECHALRDADGWHLLDSVETDDVEWVAPALRYLEWRGLIQHDAANNNRIRIKDVA